MGARISFSYNTREDKKYKKNRAMKAPAKDRNK